LLFYRQPRRLGIGKAMLIRLARTAYKRDYGRFEWAVLDWNTSAIEFYKAMGATVMYDWRIVRVTGDAPKQLAEQ
jgi:GNAT superfamily N-acetyltransferase